MDAISLIFAENNPAGIKSVLKSLGVCNDQVRLPIVKASTELEKEIAEFVRNF